MRRRYFLSVVAAGVASLAGCGGTGGRDGDEPDAPTATPTPTATAPDVEVLDASPGELEFESDDTVHLYVDVRNEGAAGSVPLEVAFGDETVLERSVEVENGRHVEELRLGDLADGYYEYTVVAGEDTATGTFTVGTPVEKPRVVTSHTVLGRADRSNARADRRHVDVEVRGDPYNGVAPPDREELLDICRKLVLDELASTNWDVVRFAVWRETQSVGEGTPHATVTWGPNGNWSGVGSGPDGDYSSHSFDVAGAPYLVTEGVEDVEADRWSFEVEFDVVNRGLVPESLAGGVSTPRTDEHRFAVDLDPGERTTIEYESGYVGSPDRTHYTIEVYGDDVLYGPRSAEIRFS